MRDNFDLSKFLRKNILLNEDIEDYFSKNKPAANFIDFMMREMSWNSPDITQIKKGSERANFLNQEIFGVKDGWSEAYEYRCKPGKSVEIDLKNATNTFCKLRGGKAEVKRGCETCNSDPYHDYFIIFK
jgi:hypothetical protein